MCLPTKLLKELSISVSHGPLSDVFVRKLFVCKDNETLFKGCFIRYCVGETLWELFSSLMWRFSSFGFPCNAPSYGQGRWPSLPSSFCFSFPYLLLLLSPYYPSWPPHKPLTLLDYVLKFIFFSLIIVIPSSSCPLSIICISYRSFHPHRFHTKLVCNHFWLWSIVVHWECV